MKADGGASAVGGKEIAYIVVAVVLGLLAFVSASALWIRDGRRWRRHYGKVSTHPSVLHLTFSPDIPTFLFPRSLYRKYIVLS